MNLSINSTHYSKLLYNKVKFYHSGEIVHRNHALCWPPPTQENIIMKISGVNVCLSEYLSLKRTVIDQILTQDLIYRLLRKKRNIQMVLSVSRIHSFYKNTTNYMSKPNFSRKTEMHIFHSFSFTSSCCKKISSCPKPKCPFSRKISYLFKSK